MLESRLCRKCGTVKPITEFHRDSHQSSGYSFRCKACKLAYQHKRWFALKDNTEAIEKRRKHQREVEREKKQDETYRERIRQNNDRYRTKPEKHQMILERGRSEEVREKARVDLSRLRAREFVHNEVRAGRIPPIKTQLCTDCGKQASQYHHNSYEREHWADVIPLCYRCHGKRHREF
jgi:hypothetical protein